MPRHLLLLLLVLAMVACSPRRTPQGGGGSRDDDDSAADDDDGADDDDAIDDDDAVSPYECGWPGNDQRGSWTSPDFGVGLQVGQRVPPFVGRDACGEDVELWDFGEDGKPVVLLFVAAWSAPDRSLADTLVNGSGAMPDYEAAHETLADEQWWLIQILWSSVDFEAPDPGEVEQWSNDYGGVGTAVLGDMDQSFFEWSGSEYTPFAVLLDEQMVAQTGDVSMYTEVFDQLLEAL